MEYKLYMKNDLNVSDSDANLVQLFGSIIVLDRHLQILGISENALHDLKIKDAAAVLDTPLHTLNVDLFEKHTSKILQLLEQVRDRKIPRQVIPLKLAQTRIYLKLSLHDEHIFMEWEEQFKKYTSAKKISEFSFLFDTIQSNNWDLVCRAVNKILHFDHVFVLEVQETGYSQVIAEHTADGEPFYKNIGFSKSFMPPEVIPFYSTGSYRYTPNLEEDTQRFYSNRKDINLLHSQLAPLPDFHQSFISQKGAVTALFFPICIDGEFWGLLIAHHHQEKKVDLQQRKLCTFAVQNATSKYESYLKQNLLERYELLREAELELKIDLLKSKTVNCALMQHMETIMEMVNADGLAIFNQGDVSSVGISPSKKQLYEIIAFIQSNTEKSLFKDNNFRFSHGDQISGKLPFAGLMYLKVGLLNDHILIWFRKESFNNFMDLQVLPANEKKKNRPEVAVTERINHDIAAPWNNVEINFVLRLNQILKESIVGKMKEKQLWSEQLLASNNELEMLTFTLSHDLKNPLSILKIGLQFLQNNKETIDPKAIDKWYSNLIASTASIDDIINNVVLLSQQRGSALSKEPIPMAYNLQQIFADNVVIFKNRPHQVTYGRLLPIWGEKSALYQVFSNLIGNAIKYSTDPDGAQISVESYFEADQVCYRIDDNGIGIPKENLGHIFEIFKRGSNAKDIEGTGVGLSLVKRIMERLGGSIKIESEVNKGTSVYLYFPIVEEFPASMLAD